MAIAVEGTVATTARTGTSASTLDVSIPSSPQSGELILCCLINLANNYWDPPAGWSTYQVDTGSEGMQVIWKISDGTETSPITCDARRIDNDVATTSQGGGVAFRLSGVDGTTPVDVVTSVASGTDGDVTTISIPAASVSVESDSWIIASFGDWGANRTVSTPDADQTLIGSQVGSNHCAHVYRETGVTSNSAYDIVMSDTRTYSWLLFEVLAATGSSIPAIYNHYRRLRAR